MMTQITVTVHITADALENLHAVAIGAKPD